MTEITNEKKVERKVLQHDELGVILQLPEFDLETGLICVLGDRFSGFTIRSVQSCDSDSASWHVHRTLLVSSALGPLIRLPELRGIETVEVVVVQEDPLLLQVGLNSIPEDISLERTIGGLHSDDLLRIVNEYWADFEILEWKLSEDGYHYDLTVAPRASMLERLLSGETELDSEVYRVLKPFDPRYRPIWNSWN